MGDSLFQNARAIQATSPHSLGDPVPSEEVGNTTEKVSLPGKQETVRILRRDSDQTDSTADSPSWIDTKSKDLNPVSRNPEDLKNPS